ncbi:MAG: element excision factor XisH family protein [Scytonema sp. PMC 1069.18]|nr:element excision factor XisH family protein [Scytonema sp. PMC 1069.18]MEC4884953.1 element excision factor XisH family protein [Scytonema sp. PMC 1070.18]
MKYIQLPHQVIDNQISLSVILRIDPNRVLYLAVRDVVYADIFDEPIAKIVVEDYKVNILVFQLESEIIFRWIPWSNIGN